VAQISSAARPIALDPLAPIDPLLHGDAPQLTRIEFDVDEDFLGLIIDWSMPLPVVSSIAPDSAAAMRPGVAVGDVMIGLNSHGLVCGVQRCEVERLLQRRPLTIVLERPDPRRVGQMALELWQRPWKREVAQYVPPTPEKQKEEDEEWPSPPEETPEIDEDEFKIPSLGLVQTTAHHLLGHRSTTPWHTMGQRWLESRTDIPIAVKQTLPLHLSGHVAKSSEAAVSCTLSGASSAIRKPLRKVMSECLLRGQDLTDVRTWHLDETRVVSLPKLTRGVQHDVRAPRGVASRFPGVQMPSKRAFKSLKSLGSGTAPAPLADQCYQQVVAEPRNLGAGPSERWPLDHGKTGWLCRLTDMVLATRIREAYEFGYKGIKKTRVSLPERILFPDLEGQLSKTPSRIDEVHCDECGLLLIDTNNTGPFYFCRICKKHGIRYELCIGCHALEVLQGEGKMTTTTKDDVHPHWQHCSHQSLERHTSLVDAYPHATFLRRSSCDFCGHIITLPGQKEQTIYTCKACPEERGYRFELCEPCAVLLRERGLEAMRDLASR